MVTIPADIWVHIAQFIPSLQLRSMLDVNSTFFQLAMDERYRDAVICVFSNEKNWKKFQRLRDPAVAHRVRSLRVERMFDISWNPLNDSDPTIPLDDIMQNMTDTVSCFTNVTHFAVKWPDIAPHTAEKFLPFFAGAWTTFGTNLQKLWLSVSLGFLPKLLSTAEGLMTPLSLYVVLDPGDNHRRNEINDMVLVTSLVPFMTKISPTLRTLSISSYIYDLELSPLFRHLEVIPNLERLLLSVDFDEGVLSDSLGLTRFLRNHAPSLRHLHWQPREVHRLSTSQSQKDERMTNWLDQNKGDMILLMDLRTLHIPVPSTHAAFSLVVPYIRRSAETLTSLSLCNCRLTSTDVNTLVSIFRPWRHQRGHFRDLWLRVEYLSPELLLLLSQTFPSIGRLQINTLYVVASNGCGEKAPTTEEEELLQAQKFAHKLQTYKLGNWSLHTISIRVQESSVVKMGKKIKWIVDECVPSVRILGGMAKG